MSSDGKDDGQDVFKCPQCGEAWRGTYRIGITVKQGKFDCESCGTQIYAWSGVRDYFKWERAGGK